MKQLISTSNDIKLHKYDMGHKKNLLFIHGGPGLTTNGFEMYFKKNIPFYKSLNANLFFYSQKNCTSYEKDCLITHKNNVNDLIEIVNDISSTTNNTTLLAHSYGCKIAYDFLKINKNLPTIFISPSENLLTPFLNKSQSLLLLLKVLKKDKYMDMINYLPDTDNLWDYSNKYEKELNLEDDIYLWANLDKMTDYKQTAGSINKKTFRLISDSINMLNNNNLLDFEGLKNKYRIFMGAQDIQMGASSFLRNKNTIFFNKSGHYPHIEEEKRFSDEVNTFIS